MVHITLVHKAFDTRIHFKQCPTLAGAGYEVHLLCGGVSSTDSTEFRLHSISPSPARPPLRRQPRRQVSALRTAMSLQADVYHLHDPHLIPTGLLLKRSGARVVYDVHEHYRWKAQQESPEQAVRWRLKAATMDSLEEAARRSFDAFVCASEALASRFPEERTIVLNNFPLRAEFERSRVPAAESPAVIYSHGTMKASRGFRALVEMPGHLPSDLDARLRLDGEIRPPSLAAYAAALPWADRIEMLPAVPRSDVLDVLYRATIGIVADPPRLNSFEGWRCNKLFEQMAAGLPVIVSDGPRWREIVERYRCGLTTDTEDPAAIAATVERLLRRPEWAAELGGRGREAFLAELNWERQAHRLVRLYDELIGPPAPAAPARARTNGSSAEALVPELAHG